MTGQIKLIVERNFVYGTGLHPNTMVQSVL